MPFNRRLHVRVMRRKRTSLTSHGTGVLQVIFSMAKVILAKHGDPTRSALRPDGSDVFFELLRNLPWEDHFHMIVASRIWPASLQDEFGLAMKRLKRRE